MNVKWFSAHELGWDNKVFNVDDTSFESQLNHRQKPPVGRDCYVMILCSVVVVDLMFDAFNSP